MLNRIMQRSSLLALLTLTIGAVVLSACDSTGANEKEDPGETATLVTVENLPADPDTTSGRGRPQGYGQFAFFNLRDSSIVLHSDESTRSDSASTKWDIAFQSTDIIVNGGANGPGEGAAYVAEKAFQEATEVNTDSLKKNRVENWYTYNANGNHLVRPTPGRTIVVRTADGESYAKIRIQSYYRNQNTDTESRYYTFEYVLQTDGTSFE